jgi:hypothetical protein
MSKWYVCAERDLFNARTELGWEPRTWVDENPDPDEYPYNMGARIIAGPFDTEEEAEKAEDTMDWSLTDPASSL